jgi:dTMP kinase
VRENDYPGRFIVVEGADGAGTTTQSEKLAEELDAFWTHEPAENRIGQKVDELISTDGYDPETIALAFAADRMVHLEEEIIPRLEKGVTVICDRYYHSSLVYQPVMGAEKEWVRDLNRDALRPDLTLVIDVSADIGMERIDERGHDGNIFEDLSFQQKVVVGYRRLEEELGENLHIIDGSQTRDEVFRSILDIVEQT